MFNFEHPNKTSLPYRFSTTNPVITSILPMLIKGKSVTPKNGIVEPLAAVLNTTLVSLSAE